MRLLLAPLLAASCVAAVHGQTVTMSGSMGDKALLVINGTPRTVAVGASFQNVKVVSVGPNDAVVELDGKRVPLQLGGAPVNLGGRASEGGGSTIVLSASDGGHFFAAGSINGKAVRFVVDTGATSIALGEDDADRIGLKYRQGQRVLMNTANGQVVAHRVSLDVVRVGDVQVYNVDAVVSPQSMGVVLLGNSFLGRFSMRREADTMTLQRRP